VVEEADFKNPDRPEQRRAFQARPAAKVMHHAYIGGLIEHVVGLCGLAKQIAAHYSELDVDLLLTAALLHDIGKLDELCYERAVSYTAEGQLLGTSPWNSNPSPRRWTLSKFPRKA